MDETDKLVSILEEWIEEPTMTMQFLRFLSHLVLFLDQIGTNKRDAIEKVLEAYVLIYHLKLNSVYIHFCSYIKRLADMNRTELVAFYVSKLSTESQIQLYAAYLEKILNNDERLEALQQAEQHGLNVFAITKQVVENIRKRPHEVEQSGNLQVKLLFPGIDITCWQNKIFIM